MNMEKEKRNFENHKATLTDYGNIIILDFKNPESSNYAIRFLFEEDKCKLHISGDLGELVASNCYNMTYERFTDFVDNIGYFKEKIDCHSRSIYTYDETLAREELVKYFKENEWLSLTDLYESEENEDIRTNDIIDDILEDFCTYTGLSSKGYEVLQELGADCFEYAPYLGRKDTGILDLYMLAFKLAKEQIDNQKVFLLKIAYSWGDEESDIRCSSFEEAWKTAKEMAINEAEITSEEHGCEIGVSICKAGGQISLHYTYDDTYCIYNVVEE